MRREQVFTVDGGTIEVLVPETEADIEALRRRQEQAEEIDDRFSFGDYREPENVRMVALGCGASARAVGVPHAAITEPSCSMSRRLPIRSRPRKSRTLAARRSAGRPAQA